mgnify:CR=1 FL=1
MTIDFRKMFKVPAAVRQSIKFSLSIREEYRVQWDRFFMETPTLEQVSFSSAGGGKSSTTGGDEDEDTGDYTYTGEGSYSMDDLFARMDADMENASTGEEGSHYYEADAEEEEAEEEKPRSKSGFALLKGR